MSGARERRLFFSVFVVAALLASTRWGDIDLRSLDLLRAIEHGRLSIDRDAANTFDKAYVPLASSTAGVVLSGAAPAAALAGGHYYCGAAPGVAFVSLPAYALARAVLPARLLPLALAAFAGAVAHALAAVGIRRAALDGAAATEDEATAAGLIHGLGTIALAYATRFYAHSLVAAAFAWALATLLRTPAPRPGAREGLGRYATAGLLAGIGVVCDYNGGSLVFLVGALALWLGGIRGALAFAAGGIPPALVLGAYQWACFGAPWSTPYGHHADPHIAWILAQGNHGFTHPSPRRLFELVLGRRRGWLWTQPAIFLGLAGLVANVARAERRVRIAAVVALVTALSSLLAAASRFADWDAGASYGARYTIAALPFVALGYPRGLGLAGRAAIPVVGVSVALAVLGAISEWAFSIVEVSNRVLELGPSLTGATRLVLGADPGDVTTATVLVSAATLALALAGGAWLASGALTKPPAWRGWLSLGVAVVAWLSAASFLLAAVLHGTARTVEQRRRDLGVSETRHILSAASDAANARALVPIARTMSQALGEPSLYVEALEKVAEFCPDDPEARAAARDARRELEMTTTRRER